MKTPDRAEASLLSKHHRLIVIIIILCNVCIYQLFLWNSRAELVVLDYEVNIEQNSELMIEYRPEGAKISSSKGTIFIVRRSVSMEGKGDELLEILFNSKEVIGGRDIVNDVVVSFPDTVSRVEFKNKQHYIARFWNASFYVVADSEDGAISLGKQIRPQSSTIERFLERF